MSQQDDINSRRALLRAMIEGCPTASLRQLRTWLAAEGVEASIFTVHNDLMAIGARKVWTLT